MPLTPNYETGTLYVGDSLETRRLYKVARALSSLRNELEDTEMGEQICRFHKRIALSRFYDFYEMAKEHPSCLLAQGPSMIEGTNRPSADDPIRKQAPRLASVVLNRIVDLMFSNTVLTSKDAITTSKDAVTASDEI